MSSPTATRRETAHTVAGSVALDGRFARELPELSIPWSAQTAPAPRLLALNEPLARELGIEPTWLRSDAGIALLTGSAVPEGATPVAQAYAGHQFGGFSPRLGDGRALLLGELTDIDGALHDLHLKGSGPTPFARGGDGYAAIGPMLREYIISEAMHALGVPTTRSLAVVTTGRTVHRETALHGALLARVASSHLRVGTFQYAATQDDRDLLHRLTDIAIARHAPAAAEAERPALALLDMVIEAQATTVARWMSIGFVHGVMNTDNMTISGETIDYGPCAFLDAYDPGAVYSSIDHGGRYAYRNQPVVAEWNLARFAETLLPLIDDDLQHAIGLATAALERFSAHYADAWLSLMRAKLGLGEAVSDETAAVLATDLLGLMEEARVDYTSTLRALSVCASGGVRPVVLDSATGTAWAERWLALEPDADAMDRVNPVYIPRNHLVEEALGAATDGDLAPFDRLLEAVARPYDVRPGLERYAEAATDALGPYTTFCGT
ncbi:protein adenylyltransferase SelO [Microcella sp.]|uniref:protein adenylyltransferase SelO n=1 Tax=Microcella sp. TaxID=1913979 RepID=UPI00256B038B|nr:YdiU family protein [Microcella sp.]MBX9471310.1 YdiU family protein [Microcella sp.]